MIVNYVETRKEKVEKMIEKYGSIPVKVLNEKTNRANKVAVEKALERYGNMPLKMLTAETFVDELRNAFPNLNGEVDSLFLLELLHYFPIEKTYISTGSYDQYLYDLEKTVIDNYNAGNFQVSYFYAHLIFMSYVYYCVERAYQLEPERMKDVFYPINSYHGRDDKPDIENYGNVYEFSKIPEKDIFKVFHIMGMEDATVKEFSKYISSRDDFAHATGKGNISEQEFRQNIKVIIGNMNTLRNLFLPYLKLLYIDFMLERLDADYDIVSDNFNDFIFDNALSISDLVYLCHLGVKNLQESNEKLKLNYQSTRNIHCAFIEYCWENDGITPPDGYPSLRNDNYLFYRYKNNANDYVENELGINEYRCVKDGGEFPVYECPECGADQFTYDAKKGIYHCFSCDKTFTTDDLSFCEKCGNLTRRNDGLPICLLCIENMLMD